MNLSLQERIALVDADLSACTLCPKDCRVDRKSGELGYCGLTDEGRVFFHDLSFSEEPEISPTYEIYLTGCSHRCAFCSVLERVEEPSLGTPLSECREDIRLSLKKAVAQGVKTLSFVGGEPTVNLPAILRLLDYLKSPLSTYSTLPIVWNTNAYLTETAHRAIEGLVDTVVGDMHFGNDDCAGRVAGVSPYLKPVGESLLRCSQYAKVIVRHLLLPGHLECCAKPVILWLKANMPKTRFSLLTGFYPPASKVSSFHQAELSCDEIREAKAFAACHLQ